MRKKSFIQLGDQFSFESSRGRVQRISPIVFLALFIFLIVMTTSGMNQPCHAQGNQSPQTHLYFFTNHGCAPCRQVEPAIEALKREGYPVTTVYLNEQPEFGQRLGVDCTPTVVLIAGKKMEGRHAGLIDAVTLKKWFAAVGVPSGKMFAGVGGSAGPGSTKVVMSDSVQPRRPAGDDYSTSTSHQGTRQVGNQNEGRAMQATVRLRVEDPAGISYATGTVIHNHQGECLVMTCGHVFRDAKGQGSITAEFGFEGEQRSTAPGQLIYYDADARDIALVAIRTSEKIQPVSIAARSAKINRGDDIFTIGCDHGEDPTVRRSRIKNRASYDGAIKYDIYGRPVDGRSGGGLFNSRGELIGVCNAAAVEVDEGIYTALDTIYWQLAKVNLEHLFNGSSMIASTSTMPVDGAGQQTFARNPRPERSLPKSDLVALNGGARLQARTQVAPISNRTSVSWEMEGGSNSTDQEVIIIVRSKSNPSQAETITVDDPSPKLLNYLNSMNPGSSTRRLEMANVREANRR